MTDFDGGNGIWLKKRSPKGVWQRRRFKLLHGITPATNTLVYFATQKGFDNPLGAILMCNIKNVAADPKDTTKFNIEVEGGRVFELQAEKAEEAKSCMGKLEAFGAATDSVTGLPLLHESEKSRKWWKPAVYKEIELKNQYESALTEQRKAEALPLDARLAASNAVKSSQEELAARRNATSRTIRLYNRVPTAAAPAQPIFAALYQKPHFTDERNRRPLTPNDDYVVTRVGDVITIPGYVTEAESANAFADITILGSYTEKYGVSIKILFSKTKEELVEELPRLSFKFMVRHSASTPNPIYLRPDDGKLAPDVEDDDKPDNPLAAKAMARLVSSVDPTKGHPGFHAESLAMAIESDEKDFYDERERAESAPPIEANNAKIEVSHVAPEPKKGKSKWTGSPYVERMLSHRFASPDEVDDSRPNKQLIRAGRVGKYQNGFPDVSVDDASKQEKMLSDHEAKQDKVTARERLASAENAKRASATPKAGDAAAASASASAAAAPTVAVSDQVQPYKAPFSGKPEGSVSIVFFGDLLPLDDGFPHAAGSKSMKKILDRADIILINLEAVIRFLLLKDDVNKSTSLNPAAHQDCAREYVIKTLESLNIERRKCVWNLANNHAGDFDVIGVQRSAYLLEKMGCFVVGLCADSSGIPRGQICKLNCTFRDGSNINIGIVSWTKFMNHATRRSLPVWCEADVLNKDWADLKKSNGIDYLIGYPHWDYEYQYIPAPETTALARKLLRVGQFDAIVGHGPHVLQPVEVFDSKMWMRATPPQRKDLEGVSGICAYSLGNLASERGHWPTKMGAMFELIVSAKTKARGPLLAYKIVPFLQVHHTLTSEEKRAEGTKRRLCALDDMMLFSKVLNAYRHRVDDLFEIPGGVLRKFIEYKQTFRIRIKTSRLPGAGTENPIFLSVKGDQGVSEEWYLESPYDGVENFKEGREDTFFVGSVRALGDNLQIVKIQIKPTDPHRTFANTIRATLGELVKFDMTDSWHVDHISIMRLVDGKEWLFQARKWIHPERPAFIGRTLEKAAGSENPVVRLNSVLDKIKTGDLICFESHSWYSDLTKKITKSKYSHVGLVVVEDESEIRKELKDLEATESKTEQASMAKAANTMDTPKKKVVLIYESTRNGDHTPDTTSGLDPYTGVHAFEVRQRIASYSGRLWWFPMREGVQIDPVNQKVMIDWLKENHMRRTPYDYAQMIGAGLDRLFSIFGAKNREDLSEMFCSEMVAAALVRAGLLKKEEIHVSDCTPVDCVKFPCYDENKSFVLIG